MYEAFFGMEHTPFARDVPPEKLYESKAFRETLRTGRSTFFYENGNQSVNLHGCLIIVISCPKR